MAFGVNREELNAWKEAVLNGDISFLTHFWYDDRFPNSNTVTKVGCSDLEKLKQWGRSHGLKDYMIDHRDKYPHYDLFGDYQIEVLKKEGLLEQLERFNLLGDKTQKK